MQRVATVSPVAHADGTTLSAAERAGATDERFEVADLVVIADFGEAIYPGLRRLGSIER